MELWIYVKDGNIDEVLQWLEPLVPGLTLSYQDEGMAVYSRTTGDEERIVFYEGIAGEYLEVDFGRSTRWKTRSDLARDLFHALGKEVRWDPGEESYLWEFKIIDGGGERTIDWDEEIERRHRSNIP